VARYYNRNPGPFPARLRNGESALLPGNSWTDISAEEDGSEDLMRGIKLGYLARFEDLPKDPPKESIPAAPMETGEAPKIPLPFKPEAREKLELEPEEPKTKSAPPGHGEGP
jgi:hypothetical protein